ncbi:extracellular solute-binding protein family 1 [Paenibacillus algicola]|uniref:Extracellular solute-binding protein family 1 n=2 Tax=Paenibacillus algicola TaxID=2565926 RepID=A0A4P8XMM7_9BACL|nr:extracellular solute-binding protein family 1 [Paenibacillus algicola]
MKKFLCLMMIVTIVTSAGCSGQNNGSNNSPADVKTTQTDSVKGKQADSEEKLSISMLAPSYAGGGWPDSNHPTIQYLNEKFNIELDVQWIPGANYDEKINVLAASGNLPDVYTILPASDLYVKWQGEGAFAELQDYVDDYPNLKNAFSEEVWQMKNPKGITYGIPKGGPTNPVAYVVRKDWLDNLGLTIPDADRFTVDEFYKIAKAFALEDPDQDGKQNTVGFTFNQEFGQEASLRYAFGLSPGWQEMDGELVPWQAQTKELKSYLAFLQKAYAEGVLDKDFPLNEGNDIQEKASSGKLGLDYAIPVAMLRHEAKLKETTPEAEFVQIPPPKGQTGIQFNDTMELEHKIVLNSKMNEDKIRRILAMFDWWVTEEGVDVIKNGPPEVYYTAKGDGTFEANEAAKSEGNRIAILNNWFFRGVANDFDVYKWDSKEYRERMVGHMEQAEAFAAPMDPAEGITHLSPTYAKKYDEINKKFLSSVYNIILGKAPVDHIDDAVATWNKEGGEQIIKEINEAYQSIK